MMFVALLIALGVGAGCYERFRDDLPRWQLVGLIVAGYIVAFGCYRIGLSLALRKLNH
jgi:uncharacterized membrane protein